MAPTGRARSAGRRSPTSGWPLRRPRRRVAGTTASAELLLRRPEDLVDLVDEPLADRLVVGLLGLAGGLSGLPEELVELGMGFEVLGLEIVGPQDPEVVLHQLGPLFFDGDRPLLEVVVVGGVVLLLAGLDGL